MYLEPMSQDDFEVFLQMTCVGFAQNSPKYQGIDSEAAVREVKEHFLTKIAPQGYETPGIYSYSNEYEPRDQPAKLIIHCPP